MPPPTVAKVNPADAVYNQLWPITPDDLNDSPLIFDAIYVGKQGSVVVVPLSPTDPAVVFRRVQSGSILPVRGVRINATGTTAEDLVALVYNFSL